MAVSKRVRYEVMRRDGHACRYCGSMAPDAKLTIDHVMPVALGGDDDPSNLVTACADCNSGKTSTVPDAPLVAEVAEADLRLAQAMRQAAREILDREAPTDEEAAYLDAFRTSWERWTYEREGKRVTVALPPSWQVSIRAFMRQGLPMELVAGAIDIAMGNKRVDDPFRYMCGVCWNRIRDMQTRAAEILAAENAEATSDEAVDA